MNHVNILEEQGQLQDPVGQGNVADVGIGNVIRTLADVVLRIGKYHRADRASLKGAPAEAGSAGVQAFGGEGLLHGAADPGRQVRSTWAKLIARVYEVDPLEYVRCHSPMKVIAVITGSEEVQKILRHLAKIGRSPPGLGVAVAHHPD